MTFSLSEFNLYGKLIPVARLTELPDIPPEQLFQQLHSSGALLILARLTGNRERAAAMGFSENFRIGVQPLKPNGPHCEAELCPAVYADIELLNSLYEDMLNHRPHLTRSPARWQELLPHTWTLRTDGKFSGYAVCTLADGQLTANELIAYDEESYNALRLSLLSQYGVEDGLMYTMACLHDKGIYGLSRVVDAEGLLSAAISFRPEASFQIELRDDLAPWNQGCYTVQGQTVTRERGDGTAPLLPNQLTDLLLSAGPLVYMNLLEL